jgi:hypothetical protein
VDKVTDLNVDDSLVPPAYVAWTMWYEGARAEAVEVVGHLLAKHFGYEVLGGVDRLLARAVNGYQDLFSRIFSEPFALSAAPSEVAAVIWRQAPRDAILRAIFLGDYRWSEDPFETDVTDVPRADVLIGILHKHESVGLLSRDPGDVPFGGRPVLTEELLAVSERQKLRSIYDAMAEPVQDPNPPDAWWAAAATAVPHLVIRTFVHDAFVTEDGRSGRPRETWQLVRDRHPSYASAVLTAWAALKDDISTDDWGRVARFVARAPGESLRDRLAQLMGR